MGQGIFSSSSRLRLYEDMIAGRISEQNFNTMLEKTQTEQTELKAKVSEGIVGLAGINLLGMFCVCVAYRQRLPTLAAF